jgi:hypothetical protein
VVRELCASCYVACGFMYTDVSNFRNLSLLFGVLKFLRGLGLTKTTENKEIYIIII